MIYRDVNYFYFTGRGRKKERSKNEKNGLITRCYKSHWFLDIDIYIDCIYQSIKNNIIRDILFAIFFFIVNDVNNNNRVVSCSVERAVHLMLLADEGSARKSANDFGHARFSRKERGSYPLRGETRIRATPLMHARIESVSMTVRLPRGNVGVPKKNHPRLWRRIRVR